MFSFISIEFGISFIAFFCLYWLVAAKPQIQNLLLLCSSYFIVYKGGNLLALLLLIVFTLFIYFISKRILNSSRFKSWLIFGIIITLVNLAFWKYFDFFRSSISNTLEDTQLDLSYLSSIVLPLGISYYSFQSISYLSDLYKTRTQNNLTGKRFTLPCLALHLSFFPTITAGPIARAYDARGLNDIYNQPTGMVNQIHTQPPRRILAPTLAMILMVVALIKTWWFSGWISENWVDPIFANPMQYQSLEILAAIYGYTVQLFLNFSGYSDLMIALGLLLGFRIPVNFRAPLLAHNIREFWARWHISLSTWIRDYIYIPLGGSKKGFIRTQINLLIAMVLSGIWHGNGWHFLIWGALHGFGLILLNISDRVWMLLRHCQPHEAKNKIYQSGKLGKLISIIVTIHFVCFCFVFFRAPTLNDALAIFQALLHNHINIPLTSNPFYFFGLLLLAWLLYPKLIRLFDYFYNNAEKLPRYSYILPLLLLLLVAIICAPAGIPGFIYANF